MNTKLVKLSNMQEALILILAFAVPFIAGFGFYLSIIVTVGAAGFIAGIDKKYAWHKKDREK